MAKGKDQSGEPIQGGKDILRWSEDMDQVLLNALCEEATKGNRHDGSWTTEAYSNVVEALRQNIGPHMTKQHIKNRMKTLKDHFAESYDLFNGLSGFAWNPSTKRFEAEEEVWEDLKRDKSHAAKWQTMQIKHYDTLKDLFGAERATEKRAFTARQRQTQLHQETIDLNESHDDISMREPEVGLFDEGQFSPPNLDTSSPANAQSHQSNGTSGSRGTKRKAPMIDLMEAQLEKMTSGLGLVADAMNNGNCVFEKMHDVAERQVTIAEQQAAATEKRNDIFQQQMTIMQQSRHRVYSESEVWEMPAEFNLLEPARMQCYEFLCTNEQKKRLLFGVPSHMRLQALVQMMNGNIGH